MNKGIVSLMFFVGVVFSVPAQEATPMQDPADPGACHDGLLMPVAAKTQGVQECVIEGIGHLLSFWDEAAYRDFSKALDADPDCLMANWGLALSLVASSDERSEDRKKALVSLQRLLETTPVTEREVLYSKALYSLIKDGPRGAAEVFNEISEKWRNDYVAVLFRAMMVREGFDEKGNPRVGQVKAREILDRLLDEKPDLFAALFERALIEETSPVIDDDTLMRARRTTELAPEYPPAHLLLGHFLFRLGRYEDAIKSFDRSAELFKLIAAQEGISMADNDGYFRAMVYKATCEWCRGNAAGAITLARQLERMPIDEARPRAKGSLIQEWEVKTLLLRLSLSEYPFPSPQKLSEMFPLLRNNNISHVSELVMAHIHEFARARKAFITGDAVALRFSVSTLDSVEEMLSKSGNAASEEGGLSYWSRSLGMAERMVLEAKTMMFPDSAEMWIENAVDSQRYSSLLLPPILPYPAEWGLARNLLLKKDCQGAIKACDQGLKRFPNHAGLLRTKSLAKKQDSPKKSSSSMKSGKKS